MAPRNPVPSLSYLCLKLISNQLIHALSDDDGKYYEVVSKYLGEATYEVLQDLMKIILNSVNLDASIRLSSLKLLLREDVEKLETGMFPQFYYEKILDIIIAQGKNLKHLNLKGVWLQDFPGKLSVLIRRLRNLESLLIPHMANDEVIDAIVTLRKISVLDICGEACYSVSGMKKLRSETLRVLDVGNFGKVCICSEESSGFDLIAEVIMNLPNLSALRTYSYTGNALLTINNEFPCFKTKLKYLRDTSTTVEIIEAISQLCPNLENLYLDSPEPGVVEKLVKLRKLNSLKLTKCNVPELLTFLRVSGAQLQVLKLNHNKNTPLDLSEICLHAPNLTTLECFQMKLTFTNLDTYFMGLQNVELLYCDMSDEVTKFVLRNSPFLKRIVIGCLINMTDGDIFRLCAECEFSNLEVILFSYAKSLTIIAVELLIGHCPNLKVMGQLSSWDIHPEEINYLRGVISSTNTDVRLLITENIT
ncbi:uncharacterized protein [Leptinotarsa decemlineata]|uniref:uncharacterized protein n=1 Tax=Leptinotarsa decemlineata TaxID=7539 RepID=UPI003D304679